MAETLRTLATIYNDLLKDNTANEISAQDQRDAIESLVPRMGGYSFDDAGATGTTISTKDVYVKLAGSTVDIPNSHADWDHPASGGDNRVQWKGPTTVLAHVTGHVELYVDSGFTPIVGVKLAKNGAVVDGSLVRTNLVGSAKYQAIPFEWFESLDEDDYLEIWVANHADTANMKVYSGVLNVRNVIQ